VTYLTVSTYQIALAAILPKAGAGMTPEALATATNLPVDLVREELHTMVQAGHAHLNAETGEYCAAGDRNE
jgi:DNA-binding IclR family transcriptional regulator